VAINDVLPLKAALRDVTANLKRLGTRGQHRPNFDGFILHSVCGATLFGWHQRHLLPTVWQSFIG